MEMDTETLLALVASSLPAGVSAGEAELLDALIEANGDAPPSPTKSLPRLPVLTLTTPAMVAQHTPTTLHTSILPAELACQLYYTMLEEAKTWSRNKWYLADRLVESPHTSGFYARDAKSVDSKGMLEAAQYWYNGNRQKPPRVFPDVMEEALHFVEKVVQEEMKKRKRYPLEWGGEPSSWCANVAASNCYRGCKEGVGAHSDMLTYLGPYPTIASISLGTTRNFRLREVIPVTEVDQRQAQTFDIPLPHNSLLIMHPPTQEKFKHSIPTMKSIDTFRPAFGRGSGNEVDQHNERINITFRFFRPDFQPESIPRCKCTHGETPAVLRSNMKKKGGNEASHFWMCNGGAQNEGKSCHFFKNLDVVGEGRGPCVNVKRGIQNN
ncbi:hypothetical protein BS47DRAFT_1377831 [Hydnum rufescens UP504]|uniref:Fe2OG dioxygenase domain-containing protein n=1 Tax=Hydnum rufescens UP504 TaxID=1448309 RepID=A0A9P6DQX1_9AGAM|nr:hypothetical protein BS47DRAFT_1377831 [Hydnum rufescens UP504]